MSIELHIERLVIDAAVLGGERAGAVRQLFERELAQWLAQPGAIETLRRVGSVMMLAPVSLQAATRSAPRVGARLAAAVGRSIGVDATDGSGRQDLQGRGARV